MTKRGSTAPSENAKTAIGWIVATAIHEAIANSITPAVRIRRIRRRWYGACVALKRVCNVPAYTLERRTRCFLFPTLPMRIRGHEAVVQVVR